MTVLASFATTDRTPSVASAVDTPVVASAMREKVKATSSAVNALPSDHLTPCFSFHVTEVKSADTPPFATVGISAASALGIGLASGPQEASGSVTSLAASLSLMPVARWPLRIVGACQY